MKGFFVVARNNTGLFFFLKLIQCYYTKDVEWGSLLKARTHTLGWKSFKFSAIFLQMWNEKRKVMNRMNYWTKVEINKSVTYCYTRVRWWINKFFVVSYKRFHDYIRIQWTIFQTFVTCECLWCCFLHFLLCLYIYISYTSVRQNNVCVRNK